MAKQRSGIGGGMAAKGGGLAAAYQR